MNIGVQFKIMDNSNEKMNKEEASAREVKKMAGMSYRQIHHWDSKGILKTKKNKDSGWRKFTGYEIFKLLILSKLRKLGVGIDDLKTVNKNISTGSGLEALKFSTKYILGGLRIYFHTDLKTYFEFLNELELIDEVEWGIFPEEPLILIQLNPLLEKVLGRKIEVANVPLSIKKSEKLEHEKMAKKNISDVEEKILKAIKEKDYQTLTIKIKDGKITFINREEGIYYQK